MLLWISFDMKTIELLLRNQPTFYQLLRFGPSWKRKRNYLLHRSFSNYWSKPWSWSAMHQHRLPVDIPPFRIHSHFSGDWTAAPERRRSSCGWIEVKELANSCASERSRLALRRCRLNASPVPDCFESRSAADRQTGLLIWRNTLINSFNGLQGAFWNPSAETFCWNDRA